METRRFFQFGIGALALILVVAVLAIFWPGRFDDRGMRLISVEDLEARKVVEFGQHEVFIVWNEGDPLVLSSDAQHLGDDVVWCESSQLFESPAHGEKFDGRGFYYAGPGRSGMGRYPYAVIDGHLYVDPGDLRGDPPPGPERGKGPPHEPQGPFCVPT